MNRTFLMVIISFCTLQFTLSSSTERLSTLRQRHPTSSLGSAMSSLASTSNHPLTPPTPQHMRVPDRIVKEHHHEEMKEHLRKGAYHAAFAANIGHETFMDHVDMAKDALKERNPFKACHECQRAQNGAKEGMSNFVNISFYAGKNAFLHFQKSKSEPSKPHTLAEFAQNVRADHTNRRPAYRQIHEQNEQIRHQP